MTRQLAMTLVVLALMVPADAARALERPATAGRAKIEVTVEYLPDTTTGMPEGRAGFDQRPIRKRLQDDGTVVIALDGQGMEYLWLLDAGQGARMQCGSAGGSPIDLRPGVPADVRGVRGKGQGDDRVLR